jgi:GNAT superfamily N-acetyltransferase
MIFPHLRRAKAPLLMALDGLKLRLASASEVDERDSLMFLHWGEPFWKFDLFKQREAALNLHPWSAGKLTWVLVDEENVIKSNLETFYAPASVDGVDGFVGIVTSVFVEPTMRGQGYASMMLAHLKEEISSAAEARYHPILALILFSEVGTAFYQRSGFRCASPTSYDIVMPAAKDASVEHLLTPTLKLATEADLASIICPASRQSHLDIPLGSLLVSPSATQLQWHSMYESFRHQAQNTRQPASVGVYSIGNSGIAGAVIWSRNLEDNRFVVMHSHADSEQTLHSLLRVAQAEAKAAGFDSITCCVEIANPTRMYYESFSGSKIVPREDAIPMYMPLSAGAHISQWIHIENGTWN